MQVGKAMRKMHERKNVGKIILSPMKEPEPEPTPAPKPEAEAAAPAEPPKETVVGELIAYGTVQMSNFSCTRPYLSRDQCLNQYRSDISNLDQPMN